MMELRPQNARTTVNETTGLLRKAYDGSGSLPLTTSYEDVRDSIEQQLQSRTTPTKPSFDGVAQQSSLFRRRQAVGMLVGGCLLCVLLIVSLVWDPQPEHDHDDDVKPVPHFDDDYFSAPFSHLDPVHDLGFAELIRADDVSPDWSFLDPSFKSPDDDRNALPTNSWYQNLLMARGEAANVQRAYPAPYLVDVVGMIPGLRSHVTHVEASAVVMQLSFNEDYGLVLGATQSIESNEKNDDRDNYQYKVVEATNLGVTLEWVSFCAFEKGRDVDVCVNVCV
jgi:hypothetical protein